MYSEEFIEEVLDYFSECRVYKTTAKEFGLIPQLVSNWVNQYRPEERIVRSPNNRVEEVPEYKDPKALAYMCGFIASDGCLQKDRKTIVITIVKEDLKTLEYFKSQCLLNEDFIIRERPDKHGNKPRVTFSASLPRLYDFCMSIGITPAKSLTLDVNLDGQTDEFKWYFLRGFIDGDGCVTVAKTLGGCSIRIISGSLAMVKTIKRIFGGTYCKLANAYHFQFRGRLAQKILERLPLDDFCMARKTTLLKIIMEREGKASAKTSLPIGEMWGTNEKPKSLLELWRESSRTVPYRTFVWRMSKDWPLDEALDRPLKKLKPYLKMGKLVTQKTEHVYSR